MNALAFPAMVGFSSIAIVVAIGEIFHLSIEFKLHWYDFQKEHILLVMRNISTVVFNFL